MNEVIHVILEERVAKESYQEIAQQYKEDKSVKKQNKIRQIMHLRKIGQWLLLCIESKCRRRQRKKQHIALYLEVQINTGRFEVSVNVRVWMSQSVFRKKRRKNKMHDNKSERKNDGENDKRKMAFYIVHGGVPTLWVEESIRPARMGYLCFAKATLDVRP